MGKIVTTFAGPLISTMLAAGSGIMPVHANGDTEAERVEAIREVLIWIRPNLDVEAVKLSPVSNLYEVTLRNGEVIFASADAKFFIPGDLYEATPIGLVNVTEQKRKVTRAGEIAALDEGDMVVFEADGERKATLTVFTDTDCRYCEKWHSEVPRLNAMGIAVRYLGFPSSGLDTEGYYQLVYAWCADDRHSALVKAERGDTIPATECVNPIAEQYRLGREFGISGTPAIMLEDGTLLQGFIPAETLATYLPPL